jgi:uncharacterized protein with PQ loop repeat
VTREEFALLIYWEWIIWTAGLVNVGAMLPQLHKLRKTRKTEDLSLQMFTIYFCIQVAFALEGYFKRNNILLWCLGLSAVVSLLIITHIIHYRRIAARLKLTE